jgi:hypothetical protein
VAVLLEEKGLSDFAAQLCGDCGVTRASDLRRLLTRDVMNMRNTDGTPITVAQRRRLETLAEDDRTVSARTPPCPAPQSCAAGSCIWAAAELQRTAL